MTAGKTVEDLFAMRADAADRIRQITHALTVGEYPDGRPVIDRHRLIAVRGRLRTDLRDLDAAIEARQVAR